MILSLRALQGFKTTARLPHLAQEKVLRGTCGCLKGFPGVLRLRHVI